MATVGGDERARLVAAATTVRATARGMGVAADSCILCTAALIDVLHTSGYKAVPLTVGVFAFNAAFYDRVETTGGVPPDRATFDRWIAEYGAWSVGIGYGLDPRRTDSNGWNGHLVAIVDDRWLVDATLDQGNRVAQGIEAGAVVQPVTMDFIMGKERVTATLIQGGALYEPRPRDQSFRASPDWREWRRRTQVAERARGYKTVGGTQGEPG